jgi:hypothetical protein
VRIGWAGCAFWVATVVVSVSAIAEPGSTAPKGAVPPLGHQIVAATTVVLATTKMVDGIVSYRVEEVWRAPAAGGSFKAGEAVRLDTRMHELLGYRPTSDQKVVLFFVDSGRAADGPLELLPVVDGVTTYSPHDASVQEKITLQQLRERVAGLVVPLRVSFVGLKAMPKIAVAHNNLAPMLVLFEDHLVQRVIFKKSRKYLDIEYVDVSSTDTPNLDIAYTGSPWTFSCKLEEKRDFVKVLKFFERKGVRLGDEARRMLGAP